MDKLKDILISKEAQERLEKPHMQLRPMPDGFEIEYGQMYGAPSLSFKELKAVSELFGTDDIDVDNYRQEGCETCDWGSDYGHTIQVRGATQNVPEFKHGKNIVILARER